MSKREEVLHPAVRYVLLAFFIVALVLQAVGFIYAHPWVPALGLGILIVGTVYFANQGRVFREGYWVYVRRGEEIHVSKTSIDSTDGLESRS
jgi:hypothetical protein